MNAGEPKDSQSVYQCWAQTVTGMLTWPLQLLETQCQVSLEIVEAALRVPDAAEDGGGKQAIDEFHRLQSLALERARKGLALPREIYQLPYRARIDWSLLPEWARPVDPEVFEGSGHEG